MTETKHTPEQDREYIEYVRPIQHNLVSQRLVSIIDRLEAEKAELVNALKTVQGCNYKGNGKCPSCQSFIRAALSKHTPESEQGAEQSNPKPEVQ